MLYMDALENTHAQYVINLTVRTEKQWECLEKLTRIDHCGQLQGTQHVII